MLTAVIEQRQEQKDRRLADFQKKEEEAKTKMIQLEQEVMTQGLQTVWAMGRLLLEKRTRKVCEEIFEKGEAKGNKALRKKRAEALLCLGEVFERESASFKASRPAEQANQTPFGLHPGEHLSLSLSLRANNPSNYHLITPLITI